MNEKEIIEKVEETYQAECNACRYATAMHVAIKKYKALMKKHLNMEMKQAPCEWWDK